MTSGGLACHEDTDILLFVRLRAATITRWGHLRADKKRGGSGGVKGCWVILEVGHLRILVGGFLFSLLTHRHLILWVPE